MSLRLPDLGAPHIGPGQFYLAWSIAKEVSLWWRADPATYDAQLVSWFGDVIDNPHHATAFWDSYSEFTLLTPEQADQCLMAARHLPTSEAWHRFAANIAARCEDVS